MKHFIFTLIALMGAIFISNAQEKSESKTKTEWTVSQTIELPSNTEMHFGTTKSGNVKAWVELPNIGKVSVSPSNAEKFKKGEVKLELVKWKDGDKTKYSIRQLGNKTKSKTPDIDIAKLF